MLPSRLYLLLLPLLVLLLGARTAPLVDPEPLTVPPGVEAPAVAKAIRAALLGRGWVIDKDSPGSIETTLNIRTHSVTLAISYDAKQVVTKYVRSTDLDEEVKDGQRVIHRNYFNWLKNVQNDIARNLVLVAP